MTIPRNPLRPVLRNVLYDPLNGPWGDENPVFPLQSTAVQWLFKNGATTYDLSDANQVKDNSALATGDTRALHVGHCYTGDGTNDHLVFANPWVVGAGDAFEYEFYYDFTGNATISFYPLGRSDTITSFRWRESTNSCGHMVNSVNTTFSWTPITQAQSRSGWIKVSYAGGGATTISMTWRSLDGSLTLGPVVKTGYVSSAFTWEFFFRGNSTTYTQGKMWGLKLSRAGVLERYYPCEEGSGTTAYNAAGGAGGNATLTNGLLVTGLQDTYSSRNEIGWTLAGAVYVPPNLASPGFDAAGNALQHSGRAPYNATLKGSNCVYMNGTGYWEVPHLIGGSGVTVSSSAGTAVPTVDHALGRITFTAGTVWDLNLSDGSRFVCSEGAGDILHDVGTNGVLNVYTLSLLGRKILAGDLSGGARYARVVSNTFSLAGVTVNIAAEAGTATITAGGNFDLAKVFARGFFDVTGFTDAFMDRKYRIKTPTSTTVLTIYDRFKRDLTGETLTFIFDETWGRTQDVFHWNLKNGFSKCGHINVPARADGSLTDASAGLPISRLPGAYHNGAETRLDLTGGVATPAALKYGWETSYVWKDDILNGNEEAKDRVPPRYSNRLHAKYESDLISYPTALARDNLAALFAANARRWGETWRTEGFGPVTWVDLDALTTNQKTNIDDSAATIAAPLTNATGSRKHVIYYSIAAADLKIGINDGNAELNPLLIGDRVKVSVLGAVRFNAYGCQSSLAPWRCENGTNPTDISLFNLTTVLRGSVALLPGTDFPRMEGINITGGNSIVSISTKIISHTFYNTGFAFRTRNVTSMRERFSLIRSGGGNGCDARHLNDSCQDIACSDGIYIGGDDGWSATLESSGVFHSRRNGTTDCELASKNNSALKIMFAQSANQAGTDITDLYFTRTTMGCLTGATGTIIQPSGVPVPSQAYDSANCASVFRRDNDGSANAKLGTISGVIFDACLGNSWNGTARTFDAANLAAGSLIFRNATTMTNLVSWGYHFQNCDACFIGQLVVRFDTKSQAGAYGGNSSIHFGTTSFMSSNHRITAPIAYNLSRTAQAIVVHDGDANIVEYGMFMGTIGRAVGIFAGSTGTILNSSSHRDISALGFKSDSGVATVDDGFNTAI